MTPPDGETETRTSPLNRPLGTIVPWVASIGLHAGLVGLGFLITWTVVSLGDDDDPVLVTAEFDALTYDPLASLETHPLPDAEPSEPTRVPVESLQEAVEQQLAGLDVPSLTLELDQGIPAGSADFATAANRNTATFAGISTSNARRIVYVIDASGSMIRSLQIVLRELGRSLGTLSPRQAYAVVFFQRNQALVVPPHRLAPATPEARARTLAWIDEHVIPAGRSNPLAALETGLRLKPDVIFLLSENITGSGEFEIDQDELLDLLDDLNPVDRRTGRRATRINCVQFLDPDPLDTLRRIARQHGGEDGYRFLSRSELGIENQ